MGTKSQRQTIAVNMHGCNGPTRGTYHHGGIVNGIDGITATRTCGTGHFIVTDIGQGFLMAPQDLKVAGRNLNRAGGGGCRDIRRDSGRGDSRCRRRRRGGGGGIALKGCRSCRGTSLKVVGIVAAAVVVHGVQVVVGRRSKAKGCRLGGQLGSCQCGRCRKRQRRRGYFLNGRFVPGRRVAPSGR